MNDPLIRLFESSYRGLYFSYFIEDFGRTNGCVAFTIDPSKGAVATWLVFPKKQASIFFKWFQHEQFLLDLTLF